MPKIAQSVALQRGFIVDTCVYPPLAYKGARFNPSEQVNCFTELEEMLIANLDQAVDLIKQPDIQMSINLALRKARQC